MLLALFCSAWAVFLFILKALALYVEVLTILFDNAPDTVRLLTIKKLFLLDSAAVPATVSGSVSAFSNLITKFRNF